ncbi:MAG: aminoacyl-tRNA hydrolase [Candidatus Saccharimonadales bacterium]
MPWLQKKPQFDNPTQFYTVGQNQTLVIVGLGNPGTEYENNRHNVGFHCIYEFTKSQQEFSGWQLKRDLKCHINTAQISDKRILVIKPTTFMNNSGEAVSAVTNFYKIPTTNIIVIHDELDINFGQIRTRTGGTDAGHNGIKSITKILGDENYRRIRIGIGPKKPSTIDSKEFVLQDFTLEESKHLANLYREVNAILTEYIYSGKLADDTRTFIV